MKNVTAIIFNPPVEEFRAVRVRHGLVTIVENQVSRTFEHGAFLKREGRIVEIGTFGTVRSGKWRFTEKARELQSIKR